MMPEILSAVINALLSTCVSKQIRKQPLDGYGDVYPLS
jgi:hypothetical protein